MPYKFKLDSVLTVRKTQRDQCRQVLAALLRRDAELLAQRDARLAERTQQLDELRELVQPGEVDIDGSAARRYYAGNLSGDVGTIDRQRSILAQQLGLCRQALIRADQAVQALEKLADKQRAEFAYTQEQKASRELEDAWRALHAGDKQP